MDKNVRVEKLALHGKGIKERILIIDDEKGICDSLEKLLIGSGYEVATFQSGEQAAEEIKSGRFDLIVSDIKMQNLTGLDLLRMARQVDPQALVILMTAYGSLETALEAINQGAYDYLLKPVEFQQLELVIRRALEKRRMGRARAFLLTELQQKNEELSDRLEEINALYEAGKSLVSTIELNELLRTIIRLATSVLHAKIGSIMLIDEDGAHLSIAAAIGLEDEVVRTTRLPIGSSIAGYVAKTKEPLFVTNVEDDPRFKRENRQERYGPASLLSVPLTVKDKVIGVINIAHKASGEEFGEHDLKLMTMFAAQAAVAIDNAATFQLLKRRVAELSTIQEISDAMSRAGSVQNLQEIIFWGIRNLMKAELTLWFRWNANDKALVFTGGAGHHKVNLELAIKTDPEQISTPEKARELILGHLPPRAESGVPTESFLTYFIYGEAGLAYVFCLASSLEDCFSPEDVKIAGLIASQATSIYERERAILNATRLLTMGNMISEISHDMRKPLTNIRGGLQIMRSRWPELAEGSDLFKMAEEEVHHLNELVRELVDFSNPNKYQTERVELAAVIGRAVKLVSRDIEKAGITCTIEIEDGLPEIFVNKNQIIETILNLLINAIDATSQGGTVAIRARSHDLGGHKMIRLEVADTGCGIDEKDKAVIFDRYYTTKETGTGLGLSVVERIVSSHGGRIEVESQKGVGSTFIIYLPR